MTSSPAPETTPGTADHRLIGRLWPLFLAAIVSLFPFTIYSTYLVPIADAARTSEAAVGTLRGLGGVSALTVGVLIAPWLGRWPTRHAIVAALALLAGMSLLGSLGSYPALLAFCLGIGATTAVLTPALLTAATTAFPTTADGSRAATLITAATSLTAVLAAPVIGVLASWGGWRGALWATAGLAGVAALLFLGRRSQPPAAAGIPGVSGPTDDRTALRRLRQRPDLLAVIGIGALRTTSFMGYLAFLAASYHERFAIPARTFTLVWTLSGLSFFIGNFLAGRWARRLNSGAATRCLLGGALLAALVAVLAVFTVDRLGVALAATAVMGLSHAVVAAVVTSLIAHRAGELTATTFSLNAAGMSLGVFAGSVIGGIGLTLASAPGLGVALAMPTLLAGALVLPATRPNPR